MALTHPAVLLRHALIVAVEALPPWVTITAANSSLRLVPAYLPHRSTGRIGVLGCASSLHKWSLAILIRVITVITYLIGLKTTVISQL